MEKHRYRKHHKLLKLLFNKADDYSAVIWAEFKRHLETSILDITDTGNKSQSLDLTLNVKWPTQFCHENSQLVWNKDWMPLASRWFFKSELFPVAPDEPVAGRCSEQAGGWVNMIYCVFVRTLQDLEYKAQNGGGEEKVMK